MTNKECNPERIVELLHADLAVCDEELAAHLESCEVCRRHLDQQAASANNWDRAKQLLQPARFDNATVIDFSAGGGSTTAIRQSVSIQQVLDALGPTDDPHRMGRLGEYEVTGVVGVGGMGVVLKAVDPALDRVVAIKVMIPQLAGHEKARRRFAREARAAAAVMHQNVIPIYSVSNDGSLPYLVMTYVRGGSLQKRLADTGALSVPEVLRIGSQIASGLAAAHEQGLVHRDIKPENILFEGDVERVTITDFGLARAVDDNTVTQAGTITGTPMYMSPEQARGDKVDQQSDLFSLGSVLYELCTGQAPFQGKSSLGVMRKIIDEAPTPIAELRPETPPWLVQIVDRLMSKEKSDRYASAQCVHELLERCLSHVQQPETVALPAELRPRAGSAQKRFAVSATAGLLIAAMAGLAWNAFPPQTTQPGTQGGAAGFPASGDSNHGESSETSPPTVVAAPEGVSEAGPNEASPDRPNAPTWDEIYDERERMQFCAMFGETGGVTKWKPIDRKPMNRAPTPREIANHFFNKRSVERLLSIGPQVKQMLAGKYIEFGMKDKAQAVLAFQPALKTPEIEGWLTYGKTLETSNDLRGATDAYLNAFRISPLSFDREHIPVFKRTDRMGDLAAVFTKEHLRKAQEKFTLELVKELIGTHLLPDDATRSIGYDLLERTFVACEYERPRLLEEFGVEVWRAAPNQPSYLLALFVPSDPASSEAGWEALNSDRVTQEGSGSSLYDLATPLLQNRGSVLRTALEVDKLLKQYPEWKAGKSVLCFLFASGGLTKKSRQLLEEILLDAEAGRVPSESGWMLGQALEDKDKSFEPLVTRLFEHALRTRKPHAWYGLLFSPIRNLARLYHRSGRSAEARDLLYRFANSKEGRPGSPSREERFTQTVEAAKLLAEVGYPVDAAVVLGKYDLPFHKVSPGGNADWVNRVLRRPFVQAREEVFDAIKARHVLDAIDRGFLLGDMSTRLMLERDSGLAPALLDLVERQKDEPELESTVVEVLKSAARANDPDADKLDQRLAELFDQNPKNYELGVAATFNAFLRNDHEAGKLRGERLVANHTGNAQVPALRDIALHLLVERAAKQSGTQSLAREFATRSTAAARMARDIDWVKGLEAVGGRD